MSNLIDVVKELGIESSSFYTGTSTRDKWDSFDWQVTLSYKGRNIKTDFHCGMAHANRTWFCGKESVKPIPPSTADVLYSLCVDANSGELSFEEFCSEFGYNNDSIKDKNIWQQCLETYPKLRRFLGDDFDMVVQAEH